jgi:hypothetical protein
MRGKKCELLRKRCLACRTACLDTLYFSIYFVTEPFNFFLVSSALSLDGLYAKMDDVSPHLSLAVMRQHIPAARRNSPVETQEHSDIGFLVMKKDTSP